MKRTEFTAIKAQKVDGSSQFWSVKEIVEFVRLYEEQRDLQDIKTTLELIVKRDRTDQAILHKIRTYHQIQIDLLPMVDRPLFNKRKALYALLRKTHNVIEDRIKNPTLLDFILAAIREFDDFVVSTGAQQPDCSGEQQAYAEILKRIEQQKPKRKPRAAKTHFKLPPVAPTIKPKERMECPACHAWMEKLEFDSPNSYSCGDCGWKSPF